MHIKSKLLLAVVTAAPLLITPGVHAEPAKAETAPLICYVGGTMRPPVDSLAKMFQAKTGIKVEVDYSSSGEALIKAKTTGRGDMIVVHDPYPGQIMKEKMGTQMWHVATLSGVIAVTKGNPKKIAGFMDLTKPGIKVIITDTINSTLGHVVNVMARKSGAKEKLFANVITITKASGEAANAVALGTGDAAIVWDAVAKLRSDKLDMVPIEAAYLPTPKVDAITTATYGDIDMSTLKVVVVGLSSSKNTGGLKKFGDFMASAENAYIWDKLGFAPTAKKVKK